MREPRRIEARRNRGVGLGTAVPSILLPAHVAVVIRRIAAELRDIPRDAVRDPAELVHWLGHRARSLDAVAGSRMLVTARLPPAPAAPAAVVKIAMAPPCPACEARQRKARRRGVATAGQLAFPFLDPEAAAPGATGPQAGDRAP